MIDCEDPIVAEYEFNINGNNGCYRVEFGQDEIVHERLEYVLNRRRGLYFDCSSDGILINDKSIQSQWEGFLVDAGNSKTLLGKAFSFSNFTLLR